MICRWVSFPIDGSKIVSEPAVKLFFDLLTGDPVLVGPVEPWPLEAGRVEVVVGVAKRFLAGVFHVGPYSFGCCRSRLATAFDLFESCLAYLDATLPFSSVTYTCFFNVLHFFSVGLFS